MKRQRRFVAKKDSDPRSAKLVVLVAVSTINFPGARELTERMVNKIAPYVRRELTNMGYRDADIQTKEE